MLRVSEIYRSFGRKVVLNGVSFELPEATIAGLIGPSGGGKSILLKLLGGVGRYQSGRIDLGLGEGERASLMFQEGALFDSLSVFDNVAFPLVGGRVPAANLPEELKEKVYPCVAEILARVGLTKAAFKMPGQISGGMRRRVSLARALVCRPKLLLLDDPTSGLDPIASSVIMNLIAELHAEYRPTTLIVSHDLRRLFPKVQKVLALFDGRISFDGSVDDIASRGGDVLRHFVSCRYDLETHSSVAQI